MKCAIISGLVVLAVIAIFTLMPALLLWYLGYETRVEWNELAIPTSCEVVDYNIVNQTCSYQCNCIENCVTISVITCSQICETCYYPCYVGFVDLIYNITSGVSYNTTYEVFGPDAYSSEVSTYLETNYPINGNVLCYYQPDDPSDLRLSYQGYVVYLVFFVIFSVIGAIILLIWFIVQAYRLTKYVKSKETQIQMKNMV